MKEVVEVSERAMKKRGFANGKGREGVSGENR